jgi:CHAT domain-containing protein/uncharacterized protein HemY
MNQPRTNFLLMLGWLLCLSFIAVGQPSDSPMLLPVSPVEREIANGQPHKWRMSVAAGQYIQIGFILQDLTMTGSVSDPDGVGILEVAMWHVGTTARKYGVISFIAEKTGAFTLTLRAAPTTTDTGRYEIKAEEPRVAVEEDRRRISAHRLWATAMKLREPQTTEARRAALAKYEEAISIFTQINDVYGQALTLNTIAGVWYDLVNAPKFLEAQDKALKLWQSLGRAHEEGATMSDLGLIAYVRYDYPKAMEWYNAALAKHRAAGDVYYEAETLNRMGWSENARGEKRKALARYEQALQLRRAAHDREGESVTLNDIGRIYTDLGEIPLALETFRQALQLRSPERNPHGAASILNRMGIVYKSAGEWQKALEIYRQSLVLARQVNDRRNEAAVLYNIGMLLNNFGNAPDSLAHFEQALQLSRAVGLRNGEASTLYSMGTTYLYEGEYQKGAALIRKSLEVYRAIGDGAGEAKCLQSLGVLYQLTGEPQKALEVQQQALQKYKALGGNANEAGLSLELANSYFLLGDKSKAMENFTQAHVLTQKSGNRRGEADTLFNLGAFHRETGALTEARTRVEEALHIFESLRNQAISYEIRMLFHPHFTDRYKLYTDILMTSERATPGAGFAAQAFQASERARARNLLELLVESQPDIRAGVDPKLLTTERELQQRRNAKAEIQTALLSRKHTPEQAAAIAKEITDITAQLNDIETQIRTASPRYAALTQPVPLAAAEIQQRVLDDDTVLLEYSLDKKRSYLWAVTTKEIHSFTLPAANEIETAARRWLDLLPKSTQRRYERETELAAAELSRLILAPATAHLQKKRLVIVADGLLQYVPFAALPVVGRQLPVASKNLVPNRQPTTDDRQRLIDRYELVTLPSASALAVLRNEIKGRPAAAKQLAVFSDPVFQANDPRVQLAKTNRTAPAAPTEGGKELIAQALTRAAADAGITSFVRLPFARQEAEAIAKLMPKEQQLKALDFTASRQTALTRQLEQYRYIHFATHGLLNSQHPELSGIVLSLVDENGQAQDGFLRLSDLYNLKLNADLVVLSACQTALGKDVRGEGLVGLTRGFMFAGAARVVASLWNVNDAATAELMQKFYRAMMVEKQTPAAALRTAQLALARDPRWVAPYYWSGFVLQGEWK